MAVYLLSFTLISTIGYLIPSGVFHYITTKMKPEEKIQQERIPTQIQIKREVIMSFQTISIWSLLNCFTYNLINEGKIGLTFDFNDYTLFYHIFSFLSCFVIHDTYFYWTHRLMHHPKLYKWTHKGHHLSTAPTAWCSLSFQPGEALLQYLQFFMIPMIISVNIYLFTLYLLVDLIVNTAGHCGYEMVQQEIPFLNTVTHHDIHHKVFNKNYGAFFNFWDIVCGTYLYHNKEKNISSKSSM